MNDLTAKEKSLILRYTQDDYTDGDPTKETWAWSLCGTKSDAAVWGSIVKKGYGWSDHTGQRENGYSTDTLGLTAKGVEAYRLLSATGETGAIKEDHSLGALCTIIRARVAEHAGDLSTEEALHMSVSLESSVQEFIDNWGGEHMTNNEWADEYLAANAEYQQDLLEATPEYSYLANLTKAEFKAVTEILKKYGVKGLLGTVLEIAQFNLNRENISAADKVRAERVTRELGALIERLEGFEALTHGEEAK